MIFRNYRRYAIILRSLDRSWAKLLFAWLLFSFGLKARNFEGILDSSPGKSRLLAALPEVVELWRKDSRTYMESDSLFSFIARKDAEVSRVRQSCARHGEGFGSKFQGPTATNNEMK